MKPENCCRVHSTEGIIEMMWSCHVRAIPFEILRGGADWRQSSKIAFTVHFPQCHEWGELKNLCAGGKST